MPGDSEAKDLSERCDVRKKSPKRISSNQDFLLCHQSECTHSYISTNTHSSTIGNSVLMWPFLLYKACSRTILSGLKLPFPALKRARERKEKKQASVPVPRPLIFPPRPFVGELV